MKWQAVLVIYSFGRGKIMSYFQKQFPFVYTSLISLSNYIPKNILLILTKQISIFAPFLSSNATITVTSNTTVTP